MDEICIIMYVVGLNGVQQICQINIVSNFLLSQRDTL